LSIRVRLFAFILLSALVLCILPSAQADVSLSGTVNFNYDSGTGATGTVRTTGTYTLASPVQLHNATQTAPLGQLFFNLTGKTTALPSSQFQFEAWNTSSTGLIPITIQTGTVKPSYALNLLNYTYSATTGNVTAYTQLSSQTVTFDFNQLGPASPTPSLSIYYSTSPISSVSWNNPGRRLTITTASSGVAKLANPTPYTIETVTMDGAVVPQGGSNYAYDAVLNIVTLTGSTVWVIQYTPASSGPGNPPGTPNPVTTSTYASTYVTVSTGTIGIEIPYSNPSWFSWLFSQFGNIGYGNITTGFGSQLYAMNGGYIELTITGWITVMVSVVVILVVAYIVLARSKPRRRYR